MDNSPCIVFQLPLFAAVCFVLPFADSVPSLRMTWPSRHETTGDHAFTLTTDFQSFRKCGSILYVVAIVNCGQPWTVSGLLAVIGKEILIYMIYGFAIGATAVMITCVRNSTIMPFIYLIVLFWMMPGILQMMGQKMAGLDKVMDYVLFCQSDQFLLYQDWSVRNIALFLVTGVVLSIVGMGILQKKDL